MGVILPKGSYPYIQPTPKYSPYFWREIGCTLRKNITFEIGSYPCADLLKMSWQIDIILEEQMMSVVEFWLLIDVEIYFSYLMTNK